MIRFILIALFLGLFLLFGIPVLGIEWLIGRKYKHAADISQLRIVQWAFRVILFISGIKLRIIGEENIPTDTPVLYVGNHRSYFDIVISYTRCPRPTGYVAKDTMARYPLLSVWMKRLYCLFLNRDDIKEGLKTILIGIGQMKEGISMCIYPEGTRVRGTDELDMLPFKEGSMKLAEKSGCPIIPMAITGSADIFEKHTPKVIPGTVILEYGKPIYLEELSKEDRKHLASYTQNIIRNMLIAHQ